MLIEELKKLLVTLKVTPEEFANKIGVGKSAVYKVLRGDTKKITKNFAGKINKAFPEYSVEYLVSLNYPKKNLVNNREEGLEKEGVIFSIDEIVNYIFENEETFMNKKIFRNMIEIKVSKRIAEITATRENLEKYLKS